MVLKARSGNEQIEQIYDLMPHAEGANYAPRLWASTRINHLLREGADKNKKEIVKLSKDYYVVTPFTSLIVLENEADYKKWKVETGRKDHWQLYPAPAKIKVVHEPLKGNYWEGREVPVKGTPGHPKTIEEIVQSVQLRIATPLYGYYQHQRRRMERFGLYALISGRVPSAAWGHTGILPSMPTSEEGTITIAGGLTFTGLGLPGSGSPWSGSSGKLGLGTADWTKGPLPERLLAGLDPLLTDNTFSMDVNINGIMVNSGDIWLKDVADNRVFDVLLPDGYLGEVNRDGNGPLGWDLAGLSTARSTSLFMPGRMNKDLISRFPMPGGTISSAAFSPDGKRLASGLAGEAQLWTREGLIDKKGRQQFGRAAFGRWLGDRDRIRQYNRRYSGYWGEGWDDGRRMIAGTELGIDYFSLVEKAAQINDLPKVRFVLKQLQPTPVTGTPEPNPPVPPGTPMPGAYLGLYTRAMGSVPGTLGTWAADRILPARRQILAMKDGKARNAALAAIDKFIAKLPKTSAATENTGVFWSHQGWQQVPTRWDFIRPQVQSWHWSRGMVDLTRYAPGLASSWADISDEVIARFGAKPAGKVAPEAARLIAAARKNTPTMDIAYVTKKGKTVFELQAGCEDRFAWTGRTSMYLRQDVVCDGKDIYHVYPELGLAARRSAARRAASLRRLVPHLMPPADELARVWDVALAETDAKQTTIRLTPIPPKASDKPKTPKAPAAKRPEPSVLVTFDNRGFLRKTLWQVDGKTKLTFTCDHADSQIKMTWQGAKGKPVEASYGCAIVKASGTPFAAPGGDMVVLDMPLRRPAHYEALLKELGDDPKNVARQMDLRRHLAMAYLQDHPWRAPWGQPGQTWQTMLAALQARAKAGDKSVALGDATIVGSAGYARTMAAQLKGLNVPAGYPLWTYWIQMGNAGSMKALAEKHPGTLVGQLAGYAQMQRVGGPQRPALAREMFRKYPASPLLYGAAVYAAGQDWSVLLDLAKMPRWRALALYTAAQYGQRDEVAEAFEAYHEDLIDRGWEVPISSHMAAALKSDPKKGRWQRVMKRWSDAAGKSKNPGAMLRLAEFAWANGEKPTAQEALAQAEKLVANAAPLTWKLARAQAMWAMGRYDEALADQQAALAALKAKGITPSPALLAASARLAQRAGKPAEAVDLELAAIAAEQPYMPKRINVHLFRQRYQWLWNQLTARVGQQAQKAKAKPSDTEAARALAASLEQAVEVWRTWSRVDSANSANLHQQLATLYRTAGDNDEAWRVVSTIVDQKPKDGGSYYHVGRWYHGSGQNDLAQQWYGKAYHVEPTNGDWIWHRAELLRNMGRKDQARKLYQEMATKKWQPRFQHYNNRAKQRLK